jgi:acyl carrier protein
MEEQIVDIWRAVLRTDEVGCGENFFDLGGDSLLLIEAHAKLQKRLAIGLPITQLFEHPTVRSLARSLAESSDPEEPLRALRERVLRRQRPPDRGQARESRP